MIFFRAQQRFALKLRDPNEASAQRARALFHESDALFGSIQRDVLRFIAIKGELEHIEHERNPLSADDDRAVCSCLFCVRESCFCVRESCFCVIVISYYYYYYCYYYYYYYFNCFADS
jgi:hypothetical protein